MPVLFDEHDRQWCLRREQPKAVAVSVLARNATRGAAVGNILETYKH
jgi:hypothetical protein